MSWGWLKKLYVVFLKGKKVKVGGTEFTFPQQGHGPAGGSTLDQPGKLGR